MIISTEKYEIRKGAYSDVFIDKAEMKAYKLFKSYNHPDLSGTGKEQIGIAKTNQYRQKVFETERDAYVKIQDSFLLKQFTPKFYGQTSIKKVVTNNIDVSSNYLLDCCYTIEFIVGKDNKLNEIRSNENILKDLENSLSFKLDDIIQEFVNKGVNYTIDSSAIWNERTFKIIDFAMIDSYHFQPIIE